MAATRETIEKMMKDGYPYEMIGNDGYRAVLYDIQPLNDPGDYMAIYRYPGGPCCHDLWTAQAYKAAELATKIDQFCYETDTYGYNDNVDDREANVQNLKNDLISGNDRGAVDYLNSIIEDDRDPEAIEQAKELLEQLHDYSLLKKGMLRLKDVTGEKKTSPEIYQEEEEPDR